MNKNKSNSDKIPMEDLFRDALNDHKEPTDEKDFDQFLNQLEETGFFNKKRRRPFFLFALFLVMGGVLLFFLLNSNNNREEENSNPSAVEKSSESEVVQSNTKDNSTIQGRGTAEGKQDVKNNKKVLPAFENASKENEQEILLTPATEILQDKDLSVKKDSILLQDIAPKKIAKKDSVRIQYIMQVDTIKTIDSLNIKKRKWDKMKGKK